MSKDNGWEVDVLKGGNIRISHERYGHYGFHPHYFSIEDRMKMIRAMSITEEDSARELHLDSYIEERQ